MSTLCKFNFAKSFVHNIFFTWFYLKLDTKRIQYNGSFVFHLAGEKFTENGARGSSGNPVGHITRADKLS